jgi:hypothetical protein
LEPTVRWLEMAREDYALACRALKRDGDPVEALARLAME